MLSYIEWLVLAGVYIQGKRGFLDQLDPFSITDHERLLRDNFTGGEWRHGGAFVILDIGDDN